MGRIIELKLEILLYFGFVNFPRFVCGAKIRAMSDVFASSREDLLIFNF